MNQKNQDKLNKQADIIFYQLLLIGLTFLAFILTAALLLSNKLNLIARTISGRLESVCGCSNQLSFYSHPWLLILLLLCTAALIIFIIFILNKIIKLNKATKKFIKTNLNKGQIRPSWKLQKIINRLNLPDRVVEINTSEPIIFCFGFLKPSICLSNSLVKRLKPDELTAALRHEQFHLLSRHPFKLFLVKLVSKALFFVPGIKKLSRQYSALAELAADQWATDNFLYTIPLARAIYKAIKWQERLMIKNGLAISFFSNITEARINKLADAGYALNIKTGKTKLLIAGFLLFLFSSGLTVLGLTDKSILASRAKACSVADNHSSLVCQMSKESPYCLSYDNLNHISCR